MSIIHDADESAVLSGVGENRQSGHPDHERFDLMPVLVPVLEPERHAERVSVTARNPVEVHHGTHQTVQRSERQGRLGLHAARTEPACRLAAQGDLLGRLEILQKGGFSDAGLA